MINWRALPGAPEAGDTLAPSADVTEGAVIPVSLGRFSVVLTRQEGRAYGWLNLCPHQFLPLDHRGDRIASADGRAILCANHGAKFDAATGEGLAGPGLGCALTAVPVVETAGEIRVGG